MGKKSIRHVLLPRDTHRYETFSPTVRISPVLMLTQLAVQEGIVVHLMDVKTACLNTPIDFELYMEQPECYEKAPTVRNLYGN